MPVQGVAISKFVLVDHTIRGFGGHFLEYAVHVLRAAERAGYTGVLATHRDLPGETAASVGFPVFPTYRYNRVGYAFEGDPPRAVLGAPEERVAAFAGDSEALFARCPLAPGDVVFLPTFSEVDLAGLGRYLAARTPAASWHVVFRHNIYAGREPDYPAQDARLEPFRQILRAFAAAAGGHDVHLYTDTEPLSAQYNRLGAATFQTLPIPVNEAFHMAKANAAVRYPLRVAYVGDARREKGYQYLPFVAHSLWTDYVRPGRVAFAVQSNFGCNPNEQPDVALARWHLERFEGPGLTVLREPLDTGAYRDLVLSADIGLLPYDSGLYYARSSGVLAECLSAGIPTVVVAGGWPAEQFAAETQRYHLGLLDGLARVQSLSVAPPREGAPALNVGDVGHAASARIPRPPGATHVLVTLRLAEGSRRPGTYLCILAAQLDAAGRPVRVQRTLAGHLPQDGPRTALARLEPRAESVVLQLYNAFEPSPLAVEAVQAHFLGAGVLPGGDCPLGAVGLVAGGPEEVPDMLRDIVDHYGHYRATAGAFAQTWTQRHNADLVVASLLAHGRTRPSAGGEAPPGRGDPLDEPAVARRFALCAEG